MPIYPFKCYILELKAREQLLDLVFYTVFSSWPPKSALTATFAFCILQYQVEWNDSSFTITYNVLLSLTKSRTPYERKTSVIRKNASIHSTWYKCGNWEDVNTRDDHLLFGCLLLLNVMEKKKVRTGLEREFRKNVNWGREIAFRWH